MPEKEVDKLTVLEIALAAFASLVYGAVGVLVDGWALIPAILFGILAVVKYNRRAGRKP